jgi:histidine ammonia-lyase
MIHKISAGHLTQDKIEEIILKGYKLELDNDTRNKIVNCREYLEKKIAESKEPIYGVTTGFGSLCSISISNEKLAQLQVNLMKSHACGCGARVDNDIVKTMILLKIQSLSYGYSGCQLSTVLRLIDFFNNDIYPIVYEQGSVGSSGDLVPVAHL